MNTDGAVIVNDYIAFSSYNTDTFLHVFSLPEFTYIKSYGTLGQGPNELVCPDICSSTTDNLYLCGFNEKNRLKKVNITSGIPEAGFSLNEISFSARNLHILNDSILYYHLGENRKITMESYDLIKERKINSIQYEVTENHDSDFLYFNNGFPSVNNESVAYAFLYQDRIDFMSTDFHLKKSIVGEPKNNAIRSDGNENIYYLYAYPGKEKFYFLRLGKNKAAGTDGKTLEVYDNEGKPLINYTFDISPTGFIVDEKSNVVYGWSSEYEDGILKYDLN